MKEAKAKRKTSKGSKVALAFALVWFATYDLYLVLSVLANMGFYIQPFVDIAKLLWYIVPSDQHMLALLIPGVILWPVWAVLRFRHKSAKMQAAQLKRRCPSCKGFVKQDATVCPRCSATLLSVVKLPVQTESAKTDVIDEMLSKYKSTEKAATVQVPSTLPQPSPTSKAIKPDSEPENGYLPDDYVDYIVRRSDWIRSRIRIAAKAFAALFLMVVSLYVITNLDSFFTLGIAILFWSAVFLQLNQRYPALMGMLYSVVLLVIGIVYVLPYRMIRKELRVVYGKDTKTIGRVLGIKGTEYGESPGGARYNLWYALQIVKYAVLRSAGRTQLMWEEFRPSPHEYPFGDAHYLLGNPKRAIPQFRYIVYYRTNALGFIRRFFHTKVLYTNAKIDTTIFVCRLVGDGVNILEMPRIVKGGMPHQELSPLALSYHYRPKQPYIDLVDMGLERQAGLVDRGVRSDAELAKEGVREFTAPAPSVVYRGLGDAIGAAMNSGPPPRDDRRPKKPKKEELDEEGEAPAPEESESYGTAREDDAEDDSFEEDPKEEGGE